MRKKMSDNKSSATDQPPPYSTTHTPEVHQQPVGAPLIRYNIIQLGPVSQRTFCPSCHETILTDLRNESSSKTHLMALVLCLVFWPIACIPYCIDSCQNANHYCPNCSSYIGTYQH